VSFILVAHELKTANLLFFVGECFPQGFEQDDDLQQKLDFVHWELSKRPVVGEAPATDASNDDNQFTDEAPRRLVELSDTDPNKKKKRADYMNTYTFYYWLLLFQKHVVSEDPLRKVLLLVDNCSCHQKAADIAKAKGHIPNITLAYLPKNSTSVTQPLDAGIIAVFKLRYKHLLSMHLVALFHGTDRDSQPQTSDGKAQRKKASISNLDGWRYIVDAWTLVKEESVRHCFHHVPIIGKEQKVLLDSLDDNTDVRTALKAARENAIALVRNLAITHALRGEDADTASSSEDENDDQQIDDSNSDSSHERRSNHIPWRIVQSKH